MPLTNLAGSFSDNLGQVPGVNALGSTPGAAADWQRIRKRFINVNKKATTSGNGLTDIDDPTYLGFTLVFDITSPLFSGATNFSPTESKTETEDQQTERFREEAEKRRQSVESQQSAIGYLIKIGEDARADYLRAFIQGIQEINTSRPYYWQTVTGIDEAWKSLTAMGPDPYVGSKEGEGITIACLEAIDLKLTALFTLYKMAVYDSAYKRFVVPQNLRYFDVDVKVGEIRQFKKTINFLGLIDRGNRIQNSNNVPAAVVVGDNASFVTFRFTDCLWVPEECGKVFDSVSNVGGEVVSTSVKWTYSNIIIDAQFAGYDKSLLDSRQQISGSPTFAAQALQFAKDQAAQVAQQALQSAANAAQRAVLSQAQGLLFGNVHGGVQNSIANILQNPGGSLVNATAGAIGADIQQNGSRADSAPIALSDNIMPAPVPPTRSLPTDRIQSQGRQPTNFDGEPVKPLPPTRAFDPSPSGPPPLKPTKVHG